MKKALKWLLPVWMFCLILSMVPVSASDASNADAQEPSVRIAYHNLAFGNQVYILYAVDAEHIGDAKPFMEFRTSEDPASAPVLTVTYSNYRVLKEGETKKYYVFGYTDLTAQQMADVIYARACVKLGNGDVIYSDMDSYSVCEYAAYQLGVVPGFPGTSNEALKKLLVSMLEFGTDAQNYFGYNTEHLANAFYKTFADTATGEVATSEKSFNYKEVDEEIIITGFTGTETEIVIPKKWSSGAAVTAIGDEAFKDCNTLTSIKLPEGIESIGEKAFEGCDSLVSLTLPVSVKKLGSSVFSGKKLVVYYAGTEAELEALLDNSAYWLTNGEIRFVLPNGQEINKCV